MTMTMAWAVVAWLALEVAERQGRLVETIPALSRPPAAHFVEMNQSLVQSR